MHCQYCADKNHPTRGPHCSGCGLDVKLNEDGKCRACVEWESGQPVHLEDEATRGFLTAIVERAARDTAIRDYCVCGAPATECASSYLDDVRAYGLRQEGDPEAILFYVADLAESHEVVQVDRPKPQARRAEHVRNILKGEDIDPELLQRVLRAIEREALAPPEAA